MIICGWSLNMIVLFVFRLILLANFVTLILFPMGSPLILLILHNGLLSSKLGNSGHHRHLEWSFLWAPPTDIAISPFFNDFLSSKPGNSGHHRGIWNGLSYGVPTDIGPPWWHWSHIWYMIFFLSTNHSLSSINFWICFHQILKEFFLNKGCQFEIVMKIIL